MNSIKRNLYSKFFFFTVSLLLVALPTAVEAGGGRIVIENYNGTWRAGNLGLPIQAALYSPDKSRMMAGEKAEFRIKDPRTGDKCITKSTVASENGQLFAECFASQPGSYQVYVHSFDSGEDSSVYVLYFNAPVPTKKPISTIAVTVIPTVKPTQLSISPAMKQESFISPTISSPKPTLVDYEKVIKNDSFVARIRTFIQSFFSSLGLK